MAEGDDQKDTRQRDTRRGVIGAEERASISARAQDMDRRLGEARSRITPKSTADSRQRGQAMGQGLKIAVDLVVGVAFGGFAGWWLDRYFGTAPWLMVVLLILGFAAGMMNVIRTARRMQAEAEASQLAASSVKVGQRDDD